LGPEEHELIMYSSIWDLWDPANLVASMVAELDDTLPRLMDVHWDTVWKTCTRVIVIVKGGHSRCLHGSRVLSCQVISLIRCILIRISTTPSHMGEACLLSSNIVMELHHC
jgi:hydroxymethylpyrimidine/phosphomethylpyrimidine kinase